MKRISGEMFLVILVVVLFGFLVFFNPTEGFLNEMAAGEPMDHECPDGQAYDFGEKRCKYVDGPRLS
jgi:hypothetical protein